MPKYVSILYR